MWTSTPPGLCTGSAPGSTPHTAICLRTRPSSPSEMASACTRASARARALVGVFVVAAPPEARLVTPLGGAVEPLVHPPKAVQSARIGGIGVVDDATLEHERTHARPLARVRRHVGSGHGRVLGDRPLGAAHVPRLLAPVVVFNAPP